MVRIERDLKDHPVPCVCPLSQTWEVAAPEDLSIALDNPCLSSKTHPHQQVVAAMFCLIGPK